MISNREDKNNFSIMVKDAGKLLKSYMGVSNMFSPAESTSHVTRHVLKNVKSFCGLIQIIFFYKFTAP